MVPSRESATSPCRAPFAVYGTVIAFALVGFASSAPVAAAIQMASQQQAAGVAASRHLLGADRGSAFLPAAILGQGLPIPVQFFAGEPGMPATATSKHFIEVNCGKAKPTIVLMPGITGSQLDGTQVGVAPCPTFTSPRQVWADISWMQNLPCFAHMLSVKYDKRTGRYSNSTGTELWAYQGGFPDGTNYFIWKTYYQGLWQHLQIAYGYQLGVNLYAAPYDWRMDYEGMKQIGEYSRLAARITAAVNQNCGQKATIIAHSMGVNMLLDMLRQPHYKGFKDQYIQAIVLIGGAFSGSGAGAWLTRLSGVMDPFPVFTNMVPVSQLTMLPTLPLEMAVYQFSMGLPSGVVLFPTGIANGKDQVLVQTPLRSYTVAQQDELLRDMGDVQSNTEHTKRLLEAGPIPGIETYCVYGTGVPTPMTLQFGADVAYLQPMRRPYNIIKGPGDGSMDINTLRLCSRIAPSSHLVEVDDPRVDHSAITREPAGIAAVSKVLQQIWAHQRQQQQPKGQQQGKHKQGQQQQPPAATATSQTPAKGPRHQPSRQTTSPKTQAGHEAAVPVRLRAAAGKRSSSKAHVAVNIESAVQG